MSAAGQVLNGRYRLERLLGGGGFADVYLATDLGPLGRQVAVKLLHAHLVRQQDFLARFKHEAGTVAQLKHPHILDVYDFGDSDRVLYLVMPFVAGGTLDERLRAAGRFDPAQTAAYLKQIAGALDYAHARRIVHRDLKPQNFLLDENDNLLLADFGIAKLLQEASQSYSGSAVIGTLPYMAPEIFRGLPVPASDQYALGCMAFQFLTGATPYTGTTEQLMYAHNFAPIPSPAEHGGEALPIGLEPILARALAKRAEDRYANTGEFARAFEAALAGAAMGGHDAHAARTLAVGYADQRPAPQPPTTSAPAPLHPTMPVPSTPVRQVRRLPLGVMGAVGAAVLVLALAGVLVTRGQGAALPTATLAFSATRAATAPATGVLLGAASVAPTVSLAPTPRPTPIVGPTGTSAPARAASPNAVGPTATPAPFEGAAFATLQGHTKQVWAVAWSPDGRTLASASGDQTVRLWDATTGKSVTLSGHTDRVWAVAWSPDGRRLASASLDNTVRLWDAATGGSTATLSGHTDSVLSVAWSPDGRTLASGSDDQTVRLWDMATGRSTATLQGHTNSVEAVAWSPDGRTLASASHDQTVRLWR